MVHGMEMGAQKRYRRRGSDLDQKIMTTILIADIAQHFRRIMGTARGIVGAQINDGRRMAEEIQFLVHMAGQEVADRAETVCQPRLAAEQRQNFGVHLRTAGTSLDVKPDVDTAPLRLEKRACQFDIAEVIGEPMYFSAFWNGIDARAKETGECSRWAVEMRAHQISA